MSKYDSFITLWRFMDLAERKRLMHEYTQKHGGHFSRDDFFKVLAKRYQGDRLKFKSVDGEPINGEAA